jgi:hypothetical protein
MGTRNIRLNLAGQELEATLAETQGSMAVAAGSDEEIAELAGRDDTSVEAQGWTRVQLRRDAVEEVMRSSARWGYNIARAGMVSDFNPVVSWTNDGRPLISLPQRTQVDHQSGRTLSPPTADLFSLVASEPGLSVEVMAQRLRLMPRTIRRGLGELRQLGVIERGDHGWRITRFVQHSEGGAEGHRA